MNVSLFLCSFLVVCRSREVQLTSMCQFVKQCIRNYINEKSECPSCRKTANEGHLRVNLVMEEAVSAWKSARCTIHFIVIFHLYLILIPRNRTYVHIDHMSCNFPKMNNSVSHARKQTRNENTISPVILIVIKSWNRYRARRMRSNVQLGQVRIGGYHRRRREEAGLKAGLMISY